ncbi:MAG: Xaa-Pro peptidase family protein [Thermoplasmata archaeon]
MATRHRRLFELLGDKVDAVVLMNATEPNLDQSFFYVTGLTSGLFEDCVAIVRPRSVEVLSSSLEETSARKAGVKVTVFRRRADLGTLLKKKLRGYGAIGLNFKEITHANFRFISRCAKGTRVVDVSDQIRKARMVKDEDEIARIAKACRIVSKVAEDIPDLLSAGDTETHAAAEINYAMMMAGAEGAAFETNASFGPATAEPHHVPGARRLRRGQLALFDFGAVYRRYVSDITRTFICGSPGAKHLRMYEVVSEAQTAAIDALRGGVKSRDVDAAAREVIDRSEFKGRFIHGTGHGLGISVHDPGAISMHVDEVLEPGMVVTVEPGVYIKGLGGIRIEDDVLVTRDGGRVLTNASKELRRI